LQAQLPCNHFATGKRLFFMHNFRWLQSCAFLARYARARERARSARALSATATVHLYIYISALMVAKWLHGSCAQLGGRGVLGNRSARATNILAAGYRTVLRGGSIDARQGWPAV
jgi:hypothetical protein